MHIWALVFMVLGGLATYFRLLDGKTEAEREGNAGCMLILSIVITIIIIALFC